jgi:membrane protein required for colicin V production
VSRQAPAGPQVGVGGTFSAPRGRPIQPAMWLDVLALAILAAFAGLGAARGALAGAMGLVALLAGYAAAVFAAPRWGEDAARAFGAPGWLGLPLAGTLGFVLGFSAAALVGAVLRRLERRGRDGARSPGDRVVGGLFGALRGALLVLMLAYLALWTEALRTTGGVESLPSVGDSSAATLAGSLVETGVEAALGDADPSGRVMAQVAARPGPALAGLQQLLEEPAIAALKDDRLFWTHVEYGNVDAALNQPSFLQISYDRELRARLCELGFVDARAVEDPEVFRAEAARVLAALGPQLRELQQDPELQELMRDPDVLASVQSGDTFALLADARFRAVVGRALERVER